MFNNNNWISLSGYLWSNVSPWKPSHCRWFPETRWRATDLFPEFAIALGALNGSGVAAASVFGLKRTQQIFAEDPKQGDAVGWGSGGGSLIWSSYTWKVTPRLFIDKEYTPKLPIKRILTCLCYFLKATVNNMYCSNTVKYTVPTKICCTCIL